MIKKIVLLCLSVFLSLSLSATYACPQASAIDGPGFCSSFRTAVQCSCMAKKLPSGMCVNMKSLYDRMIAMFGTLQRGCEFQHETTTQNCINSWNCYRLGGKTTLNQLCSGTGNACE